jgi:penicillin-binding protein 1C
VISDTEINIATERGIYKPEDYDRQFRGDVLARTALASSLNVPAVRILMLIGPDAFLDTLHRLGFTDLRDGDYYGFSLALGTLDVNLIELTNAYRTLANRGLRGEPTFFTPDGTCKTSRVFTDEASFIVSDILSDREARSETFGFENLLATPYWTAVKTGTSKGMRDNWCIGYSRRFTVGVWVGNFSGAAMWDVSGITGAAPLWHEIMDYLHRNADSTPPAPSPGVRRAELAVKKGLAPRKEWFIVGTEPLSVEPGRAAQTRPRIAYPVNDTIFAVDPDIPEERQVVFFETGSPGNDVRWRLNGEVLCRGDRCAWKPRPGKYVLSLVDQSDAPLDQVRFSVRD